MFCQTCGEKLHLEANFCPKCGAGVSTSTPSPLGSDSDRVSAAKKVMSFEDYRKVKGKQWKSLVSKPLGKKSKSQSKESNVTITIGLYEWHTKEVKLKPKRGKRMALVVTNTEPYASLLEKAIKKWRSFHSDCFDDEEDYMLLLENCKEALFLPGSYQEFFSLKRYREELGRDYNKIILYLCTRSDYHKFEEGEEDSDGGSLASPSPGLPGTSGSTGKMHTLEEYFIPDDDNDVNCVVESGPTGAKRVKQEPEDGSNYSASEATCTSQISSDEMLARELQLELNSHPIIEIEGGSKEDGNADSSKCADLPSVIKPLEGKVDMSGQFFLVIRRGITFQRLLTLWQRECKRNSPEKVLRVKYVGENGIDSGAMSKECLAKTIPELGAAMFPNGAPVDSVYNIHNGKFRSCGQLVATSIVQGGPPPHFLHENVFKMLVDPNVDVAALNPEEHLTKSDLQFINRVKDDVTAHQDVIIDNGYTGVIDDEHKEDIAGTMMVNMIAKRLLYLKEFAEGMKLFGVIEAIRANPDITKSLFVKGEDEDVVDANYVFSLMCPEHSPEGSSKKAHEEQIMDNLQDFLMSLEDESITGYAEAIAWAEEDPAEQKSLDDVLTSPEGTAKFEMASITPSGVLGWLTGQQHKPLNGDPLNIIVEFDHECMSRNPGHTICFPTVRACGRVITFPVAHMTDSTQFCNNFLLAYCKGGAFANV